MAKDIDQALLESIEQAAVIRQPFDHFIIDNFLPEDLLADVQSKFEDWYSSAPDDVALNGRLSIGLGKAYVDSSIEEKFQTFLRGSVDWEGVVRGILEKFGSTVHPSLKSVLDTNVPLAIRSTKRELENLKSGSSSLSLDVQAGMNPIGFAGLEPHIDAHHKLIASLLYIDLSEGEVDSGGDLLLHEANESTRFYKNAVHPWYAARPVKRIRYKNNRLVVLLNSKTAVHSVQAFLPPNDDKPHSPRCLINIIAEASSTDYLAYDPKEINQVIWERIKGVGAGIGNVIFVYIRSRLDSNYRKTFRNTNTWAKTVSSWKYIGFQQYQKWRKILKL